MTEDCKSCRKREASGQPKRPLFNYTNASLEVMLATVASDEACHELSHRRSKRAREILVRKPVKQHRLRRPLVLEVSSMPGEALRKEWIRNELYQQRIADMAGSGEYLKKARELKTAIEMEWTARRRGFSDQSPMWSKRGITGDGPSNWPATGLLSFLGYRVSDASNRTAAQRRWLLESIIGAELPPLNSETYLQTWGDPLTSKRLEKLLRTLKGLAAIARERADRGSAPARWEADAAFLEASWIELR